MSLWVSFCVIFYSVSGLTDFTPLNKSVHSRHLIPLPTKQGKSCVQIVLKIRNDLLRDAYHGVGKVGTAKPKHLFIPSVDLNFILCLYHDGRSWKFTLCSEMSAMGTLLHAFLQHKPNSWQPPPSSYYRRHDLIGIWTPALDKTL